MGDEQGQQDDDRENAELDHAGDRLEHHEGERDCDDDDEQDRHLSRLLPNLACANITIPTASAMMIAILMILSTRPISRMPMITAMIRPIMHFLPGSPST